MALAASALVLAYILLSSHLSRFSLVVDNIGGILYIVIRRK